MIEFKNIAKSFNGKHVLSGVTFAAHDSRVTGFVGANGAGKSTTLKIFAGIIQPDSGIAEFSAPPSKSEGRQSLGIFLGPNMLPSRMIGADYISYICVLRDASLTDGAKWLNFFGLEQASKLRISSYSLGMRQRLALAAALIGDPHNIVLDEPLNGLDIEGVKLIRDLLLQMARDGHCILLSSHLLSELELVAQDIAIISMGEIVSYGSLNALRDVNYKICEVETSQQQKLIQLLQSNTIAFHKHNNKIIVEGLAIRDLTQLIFTANIEIDSISKSQRSIEQMYLDNVKGAANAK